MKITIKTRRIENNWIESNLDWSLAIVFVISTYLMIVTIVFKSYVIIDRDLNNIEWNQ